MIHATLVVLGALLASCGAKTGLSEAHVESDLAPEHRCEEPCAASTFCRPLCLEDGECVPLPEPECGDDDRCTTDRCDAALDRCVNEIVVVDEDRDGHVAPLECGGTDCDDQDPLVHPGAPEACNGLDDDCDGLIDEDADLVPWGNEVPIAASRETDDAGSVVWTGESYVVGFWDYRDDTADVYLLRLDAEGNEIGEEERVTTSAGDGYGPSIVWTGRELGVTWNDRRDGNYEVYFARFDAQLRRLSGDIRLSVDPGWSVYPQVAWSSLEYLVAWQDDRLGVFQVFARRIGPDGPAGPELQLSDGSGGRGAESPVVAFDGAFYHLAWLEGGLGSFAVRHARFDQVLEPLGSVLVSDARRGTAAEPEIAAGRGVVAVSWEAETESGWESSVAVLTSTGQPVAPARVIDPVHAVARQPSLLWVNGGFVMVWSVFSDPTFDLHFAVIDPAGEPVLASRELVVGPGDAVGAALALGPGEVGVAWSDSRAGNYDVYFTRLLCAGL
jgi:hypothetical protein